MSAESAAATFALRAMTPGDVASVAAIEAHSFRIPWSADAFRHELDIPFSRAWVAHPVRDPCTIAGYVVLWRVVDEVHLLDLAVAESFRGAGLGRLLVDQVIAEASDCGARLITLEVAENNQPARVLYERAGFATVLVRRDYYRPGDHAAVMQRVVATQGSM